MTSISRLLEIDHDASHAKQAEHVYGYLRRQAPSRYPEPWARAPESLRLAITLGVITGADHATAKMAAGINRKLDQVGAR